MSSRMGMSVDAVIPSSLLSKALDFITDGAVQGIRAGICMDGIVELDGNGEYIVVLELSDEPIDPVGMFIASDEGGVEPSVDDLMLFHDEVGDHGILVVSDPFACEFAVHWVDGDAVRRAEILLTE